MKLQKHSAVIQMSNKITLQQRKVYNFLLYLAKKNISKMRNEDSDKHMFFETTLTEVKNEAGIKVRNFKLKDDLQGLQKTLIEMNILEKNKNMKDTYSWLSVQLLGSVKIQDGLVQFSFPYELQKALFFPKVFGLLDMKIVKGFESKYTIALYELLEDYKKVSIPKMSIEEFRKLMGIENKYHNFSDTKRFCINTAIKEVNAKTNFTVDYEVENRGRKVTHIKFNHTYKNDEIEQNKKQKSFDNFNKFKEYVVDNYKGEQICNGVDGYESFVIFSLDDIGYIYNEFALETLQANESLKVWSWLFNNQDRLGVIKDIDEELVEAKKLIGREFSISYKNPIGMNVDLKLILKDVKRENKLFRLFFNYIDTPQKEDIKSEKLYSFDEFKKLVLE